MSMLEPQSSLNNSPASNEYVGVKIDNRFKGVLERKIEGIFDEAQYLGWNYYNFVASVLEVLSVLHYRNKLR